MKRKRAEIMDRNKESKKPKTNVWGLPNFLPDDKEGEDERPLSMYKQRMRDEYKKLPNNRKQSTIDTAMEKTFSKRRDEIVLQRLAVGDLCDDYPALKDAVEVSFLRIMKFFSILTQSLLCNITFARN